MRKKIPSQLLHTIDKYTKCHQLRKQLRNQTQVKLMITTINLYNKAIDKPNFQFASNLISIPETINTFHVTGLFVYPLGGIETSDIKWVMGTYMS